MLTKGRIKLIESLKDKKTRTEKGLFIVEGAKSVAELIESDFKIETLFGTKDFLSKYRETIKSKNIVTETVEPGELKKIGTFEVNDSALAVVRQKPNHPVSKDVGIILALCDVRDPGNLGTIIRIADWYGVKQIIASKGTTDLYNSKTISASMGSFVRVNVFYTDLDAFLRETQLPVFGALLKGDDVHKQTFPKSGILVVGNESNGIQQNLISFIKHPITIPSYGEAESLNVAIATAVILDNWKQRE